MLRWIIILLISLIALSAQAQTTPVTQCVTPAVAGGTGDAITIPTLPCIPTTTLLILTITNANATTQPTIKPPTTTALPIVATDGTAIGIGILTVGYRALLTSNGSKWFLLNSPTNSTVSSCAPTVAGLVPATGGGTTSILRADCTFANSLIAAQTGAITTIGAGFLGATSNSASADLIESYVFCTSPNPASACGGGNFDGIQGIGISNSGTTTAIVGGVSGYVLANQAFVGFGPSSVALFGTGVAAVDNSSVWGLNTNVSDRIYRVAQPAGSHNRRVTGAEIDVSASYTDTNVTAILIAGNSVVQPNNSTAIGIVGQDFSASSPGAIAKWSQALYTYDGTVDLFAFIGSYCSSASHTQTCDSQGTQWIGYVSGTPGFGELEFGPGLGTNPCPSCNHTTYQFQMNYGLNINTGGAVIRSTTDHVLEIAGNLDLSSGTLIESRNDVASSIEPVEILSSNILLNSNILQVNNGSGITTGFTGSCTGGAFHAINGIVVSCP